MRVKLYDSTSSANKYAEGVIENAIKQFMTQPCYVSFEVDRQQPHLNLMNAAAMVSKMEEDNQGNIWGELQVLPTPKGKVLEEMLNVMPDSVDYGLYGMGRKEGDTIIGYELIGVSVFPKAYNE